MSRPAETEQPDDDPTTAGFGHVRPEADGDTAAAAAPTNDPTSLPNQQAERAAKAVLTAAGVERIDLACTLGSGWSEAAGQLGELIAEVDADQVPGFHHSGVPGHTGSLKVIRTPAGQHILVIGARTHYYEGHGVDAVAHGVRTDH